MIPRRIAFFWTGQRLSWLRYMTLWSFRALNPDWPMRLYLGRGEPDRRSWRSHPEQDRGHEKYFGPDYLAKVRDLDVDIVPAEIRDPQSGRWMKHLPPACQSDLIEWQFLSEEGGVWGDMDILFVRPMRGLEPLLARIDAGIFTWRRRFATIGFLASSPGNGFFGDVRREAFRFDATEYQGAGAQAIYRLFNYFPREEHRWWECWRRLGPASLPLEDVVRHRYRAMDLHRFADEVIYPWDFQNVRAIFSERHDLPERCLGIHWFGGCPIAQAYNAMMTEGDFRKFDSTLSACLDRLLAAHPGGSANRGLTEAA